MSSLLFLGKHNILDINILRSFSTLGPLIFMKNHEKMGGVFLDVCK